jgi:hypothetical protein
VQSAPVAQYAPAAQTAPVHSTPAVSAPAAPFPSAIEPAPRVDIATAVDETGELMKRLETAMADYSRLVGTAGPETDDADFARRALKIGLIVRDTDAWILDVPSGRWFHYNGLRLSPLGGWNSRPPQD